MKRDEIDHQPALHDALLRRWLLGELNPGQAEALEALLFETDLAERLADIENDLIDDYAAGRLSRRERHRVEQRLLITPADHRRLRFARTLQRLRPIERGSLLRHWPLAAASLTGLALLLIVMTDWPAPWSDSRVVVISLADEQMRGDPLPLIRIPAGAETVRIQAEVTDPADRSRRLRISTSDGRILAEAQPGPARLTGPYAYVELELAAPGIGTGRRRISLVDAATGHELASWVVDLTHD